MLFDRHMIIDKHIVDPRPDPARGYEKPGRSIDRSVMRCFRQIKRVTKHTPFGQVLVCDGRLDGVKIARDDRRFPFRELFNVALQNKGTLLTCDLTAMVEVGAEEVEFLPGAGLYEFYPGSNSRKIRVPAFAFFNLRCLRAPECSGIDKTETA